MKTMLNIKIERDLKTKAQGTARGLGLPLSAVVSAYLKNFVVEQRITFVNHPIPNKKTQAILSEALKDAKKGKTIGPFHSAQEAVAYLDSDED
jgi:antitoxin component of RelBE/YafQ-DinJ toxin-antitoxin module